MSERTRTLLIDEEIAVAIERQAADLGVTASQLLAVTFASEGIGNEDETIIDLEARWERARNAGNTVSHERVAQWLETWGQKDFNAWGSR